MNSKLFTERGQALILIALAAVGIFGVVGLAIDGGAKFADQRAAQNAADTAALAAAYAKVDTLIAADADSSITTSPAQCDSGNMVGASDVCTALVLAGLDRADSNGYSIPSSTVEIYSPPLTGPNAGNANFVQVIITSNVDTTFARVIGIQQTQNIVLAEGSIRHGGDLADGAMLIAYDPHPTCSSGGGSGGGSVDISGDSHIYLDGGGIFVNSQENCGYYAPNCPDLTMIGGSINSASTVDNIDQASCAPQASENINNDPVIIPDDVYWPEVPPECSIPATADPLGTAPDGNPEWLIHPGYYEDFPQASLVTNKSHIYMESGVYCIDPGGPTKNWDLSWSPVSFVELNGSTESNPSKSNYNKYHAYNPDGVTLYVKKGGGFSINSNNPTYLDNTTAGDFKGYLIVLEGDHTSHPTCSVTGGANVVINGMIYAPYCEITVNGGSGTTAPINAQFVGWHLTINGGAEVNIKYDPDNQVTITSQVGLVR